MASWASMAAKAAGEPEQPAPMQTRAARVLAEQAAERAKSQPQGEAETAFLAAVDRLFARWTLLQLAVDMGWGDGNGARNIQFLKEDTLEWLQKRNPNSIEPSDLEIMLSDFINDYFHTIAEHGSPMEVANLITTLYRQCSVGDLTIANQILTLPLPEESSKTRCQAGAEPAEFDGDMSDDDSEIANNTGVIGSNPPMNTIGENSACESNMALDEAQPPTLEPVDDGWTSVGRSGRRGGRH
mmetsp:Transcript_15092/g.19576  ORF Transcript_15092/g.19576 Transcript_15092/m.19576 type:complete len:241 (-) Transcript_15092:80-802(-)